MKNLYKFCKSLIEFTSDAIEAWSILCGRIKFTLIYLIKIGPLIFLFFSFLFVGLTGTFIHAQGHQHCYKSTRCPMFVTCLQHKQTNIPFKESWLKMTMSRHRTRSFQGFTSFISTPDFIKDEAHQPHSYPNLLVNLSIVGHHGDPNVLNKALKHLGHRISISGHPNSQQTTWKGH